MNIEYIFHVLLRINFSDEKLTLLERYDDEKIITWEMFKNGFWSWFYAVTTLTRNQFTDLWINNCFIGFMSKSKVNELIRKCPKDTFLLRFSDRIFEGKKAAPSIVLNQGTSTPWHSKPEDSLNNSIKSYISQKPWKYVLGSKGSAFQITEKRAVFGDPSSIDCK